MNPVGRATRDVAKRSQISETSMPMASSASPWRKNSSVTRTAQGRATAAGLTTLALDHELHRQLFVHFHRRVLVLARGELLQALEVFSVARYVGREDDLRDGGSELIVLRGGEPLEDPDISVAHECESA